MPREASCADEVSANVEVCGGTKTKTTPKTSSRFDIPVPGLMGRVVGKANAEGTMAGRVFFDFKDLDVYRAAVEFYALACALAARIPRDRFFVTDQFLRAALSILLNTGEGAGPLSPLQKAAHFRRAHGSATECAALLDALVVMKVLSDAERERHEQLLARIAAMLTKLAQLHARRGRTKTKTTPKTKTDPAGAPGGPGRIK